MASHPACAHLVLSSPFRQGSREGVSQHLADAPGGQYLRHLPTVPRATRDWPPVSYNGCKHLLSVCYVKKKNVQDQGGSKLGFW